MVSQIKCNCPFTFFTVSDVMTTSANGGQMFFNVYAECTKCGDYQVVSVHVMPQGGSRELFYEHYEMTKEFYAELSQ